MRTARYEIVRFDAGLLEPSADLRRQTFGNTLDRNIAYLRWKYLENPYLDEPLLFVALRNAKAVGMRGFYGTSWMDADTGKRVIFPIASDLAIHPEHRDQHLFEALNDVALATTGEMGYRHVLNLSASGANAVTSMVRHGWRRVAPCVPVSTADRGTRSIVHRVVDASKRRLGPFRPLDRQRADRDGTTTDLAVAQAPPVELMTSLQRIPGSGVLAPALDRPFLTWRYRNPLSHYRFLSARIGSSVGYVVLRSSPGRGGRGTVFVLDWGGAPAVTGYLLARSIALIGASARVHAWSGGVAADTASMLDGAGLTERAGARRSSRSMPSLLARPTSEPLDRPSSWTLGRLDLREHGSWTPQAVASDSF